MGFRIQLDRFCLGEAEEVAHQGSVADFERRPREPLAIGKGKTTRKASEICLLGKRGGGAGIAAHDVVDVVFAPVREGWAQADEVYQRVERLIGGGPYLEAFARQTWPGWHSWGDQVGMFDEEESP